MAKTTGKILKSKDVKFEGLFHLDVQSAVAASPLHEKNRNLATPQLRIVEKDPEFAVLELTCSCGSKSYIRCEYDSVPSEDHESQQNKTNSVKGENNNAN